MDDLIKLSKLYLRKEISEHAYYMGLREALTYKPPSEQMSCIARLLAADMKIKEKVR